MKTPPAFSQEQSIAMTPDLTALVASEGRRNVGEAGFNTIGLPRIADILRRRIASPLPARSEAEHLRGSSCSIMYTKIRGRSACSLVRISSPRLIGSRSQLKIFGMWNAFKVALFEPEYANLPPYRLYPLSRLASEGELALSKPKDHCVVHSFL